MHKGIIIAYSHDASAGIIQTEDLKSHYFSISHWLTPGIEPCSNLGVTFEKNSGGIRNVRAA